MPARAQALHEAFSGGALVGQRWAIHEILGPARPPGWVSEDGQKNVRLVSCFALEGRGLPMPPRGEMHHSSEPSVASRLPL